MKWAIYKYIHLDRVASPWLIKRFVDPAAELVFIDWEAEDQIPPDAIPLGVEGAELGLHDVDGTTFEKVLRKYELNDPALKRMAAIIAAGVRASVQRGRLEPDDPGPLEGIGVMAISRGMMLLEPDDEVALERSMMMYDALYLYCRSLLIFEEDPSLEQGGLVKRTTLLRERLEEARRQLQ
jgi:hypothetical protein